MQIEGVTIVETFAEAFPMWAARMVITAAGPEWARLAAETASGLATSIVGCNCEAGVDQMLTPEQTRDGRPGAAVLLFAVSRDALEAAILNRAGQAVMTAPTTALFDGLSDGERLSLGNKLRYFGDGFQSSKVIAGKRYWRIPVGDGEFLVEENISAVKGVGGGNFLILGENQLAALNAAACAAAAVRDTPGAIAPFPGGICRSPSKVGSRYQGLRASTNDSFCPTLRGRSAEALPDGCQAVYEIVIDGIDELAVKNAMRAGILAACKPGVLTISAGNYGGKLGPYHFHLHELLTERVS
ncbi:MAG: formylmethanofuran--tetrahydromethanopterin N-formyltransferase [Chloroflexi bacterium]|nr:MAG: formylmethanofuran--tetrahydromethanopterin N-formyltransferase [Chloroflexota bacterium]